MTNRDKLDNDELLEVPRQPKKSKELEEDKSQSIEMDLWDRSKALFFGTTWENY